MERSRFGDVWAAWAAEDEQREQRAQRRRRRILLTGAGLVVLLLAVLGGRMAILALTAPPPPTSLRVVLTPGLVQSIGTSVYVLPPLDRTVTAAGAVHQLYDIALGLPPPRPACDDGPDVAVYVLTFSRGTAVVLTAQAHIGSCGYVLLGRGTAHDSADFTERESNDAFWSALAQALGVSVQQLIPTPVPVSPTLPLPNPLPASASLIVPMLAGSGAGASTEEGPDRRRTPCH